MNASFGRGFDGWLYTTHGYNNNSTVRGRDGHEIQMNSGNTYRVRLDGSRVEQYTWGQVNPFGMCFDSLANMYTADCHSAPIYQLLRGAYYPSFGKPHDGLGFGPETITAYPESTAIAGITYYAADQYPAAYRDCPFVGDVVTNLIATIGENISLRRSAKLSVGQGAVDLRLDKRRVALVRTATGREQMELMAVPRRPVAGPSVPGVDPQSQPVRPARPVGIAGRELVLPFHDDLDAEAEFVPSEADVGEIL